MTGFSIVHMASTARVTPAHDVPVAAGIAVMAVGRRRDGEDVVLAGNHDDAHAVVVAQFVERAAHLGSALRAAALAFAAALAQVFLDPLQLDGRDLVRCA